MEELENWIDCCHTRRCLNKAGILNMEQLSEMTKEDLLKLRGVGPVIATSVTEIIGRYKEQQKATR